MNVSYSFFFRIVLACKMRSIDKICTHWICRLANCHPLAFTTLIPDFCEHKWINLGKENLIRTTSVAVVVDVGCLLKIMFAD